MAIVQNDDDTQVDTEALQEALEAPTEEPTPLVVDDDREYTQTREVPIALGPCQLSLANQQRFRNSGRAKGARSLGSLGFGVA